MRYLTALAAAVFLSACGVAADSGTDGTVSVEIVGNIYNVDVDKPTAENVTLGSAHISDRLGDVKQSEFVNVTVAVTNNGTTDLKNLSYLIEVEASHFGPINYPEYWQCKQCFLHASGSACNGVWREYSEPLSVCEGEPSPQTGYCYDTFFDGLDCSSPFWEISYQAPGSGFWEASGGVTSLAVGATYATTVGLGGSILDLKNDNTARWTVKDSDGGTIDNKEYLFNVVP